MLEGWSGGVMEWWNTEIEGYWKCGVVERWGKSVKILQAKA
ncbi:MAG: hypothetical protein WAM73_03180 [Desulfobacterales bacterium]